MRLKTLSQRVHEKNHKLILLDWHDWFAWYPVSFDGEWYWLELIERCRWKWKGRWQWLYRDKDKE